MCGIGFESLMYFPQNSSSSACATLQQNRHCYLLFKNC